MQIDMEGRLTTCLSVHGVDRPLVRGLHCWFASLQLPANNEHSNPATAQFCIAHTALDWFLILKAADKHAGLTFSTPKGSSVGQVWCC